METTKQFNNLAEQIEYGALANSCGFGQDESKSSFRCIADEMLRLRKENEALKSQRPRYTVPQDEHLIGDAAFDYYWTRDDADMTIWKVPRHLAEVKSTQTSSHGAVEQAFYDEKFGEEYGKLEYLIVREMKEADLIKRKIQHTNTMTGHFALIRNMCGDDADLATEILKTQTETGVIQFHTCDECHRYCYTGGSLYPDGYVCADCDEDEENSEDDE